MSDGGRRRNLSGLGGGGARRARQSLVLKRANLQVIAGATRTGKTVTLQGLAEGFSAVGVRFRRRREGRPVAGARDGGQSDVETARGLCQARGGNRQRLGLSRQSGDLLGSVRRTGPSHPHHNFRDGAAAARAADGSRREVQEGVLSIAFSVADEQDLLLLDMGDLQAMLAWCAENAGDLSTRYGKRADQGDGGDDQRRFYWHRKSEGGDHFFGEPALDIMDMIECDDKGRGYVSILAADKLMASRSFMRPSCSGCCPRCSGASRDRRSRQAEARLLL